MKRKIQGGYFDDSLHEYTDDSGVFVPSVTQVISLVRYSHFDGVDKSVVANAGRRGTNVHWLTECYDADKELPPPWTPEEEMVRFNGYRKWKEESGFIPEKIEYPLISSVYGYKYGCTIDRIGYLSGKPSIVELKFTSSAKFHWGIQLAAQEIAITGDPFIGKYLRMVCHVNSLGRYKQIPYEDARDSQRFIFALGVIHSRIEMGQDVRSEIM